MIGHQPPLPRVVEGLVNGLVMSMAFYGAVAAIVSIV